MNGSARTLLERPSSSPAFRPARTESTRGRRGQAHRTEGIDLAAAPPEVVQALRAPGQPLSSAHMERMKRRFGYDFGAVRIHADHLAAESATALGALAYAVGPDVVFGAGRYRPDTLAGQRLLEHELGHVAEQGSNARSDEQATVHLADPAATSLASRPEEERKRVRVLDKHLSPAGVAIIEQFFVSSGGKAPPTLGPPKGVDIDVGASIPAARRVAFVSAAASLVTPPPGAAQAFLEPDSTIELEIAPVGAVVRFTRLIRAAGGPSGGGGAGEVVLVESAGPIRPPPAPEPVAELPGPATPEAGGTLPYKEATDLAECVRIMGQENAAYCRHEVLGEPLPPTRPAPTQLGKSTFKVHTHGFTRGPGWRSDQWQMVVGAIEILPDRVLSTIEGERFEREPKNKCTPEQVTAKTCDPELAGETFADKRKIIIFDNAFTASTTRFGLADRLTDVVAHEVGHQVAYAPLSSAFAGAKGKPDEQKKVLAARSRSGGRFEVQTRSGKKIYMPVDASKDLTPEFRRASMQDGLQVDPSGKITGAGITEYGQKSWEELFAESFAEYILDPELLKALRPHVHGYLTKLYPQP